MAETKLSDVIVPELFNPYVVNRTMELSALVQSGIVINNPEFDRLASQASPLITMPFYEDLTGASESVVESEDLTANNITSKADVAAILRRAKMWARTDLSAAMSGYDPMRAIGDLVAGFWSRDMQKELISILTGVFASTKMKSDHVLDISAQSDNAANFSGAAFIEAQQLLGDAKSQLTAVAMHSATHSYLMQQNLIETIRPSDSLPFDTYMGKRVIVDDGCPVTGAGDSAVYTTYLFADGCFALGNGVPEGFVQTETDRDKRKGSGIDYLINRKTYILHPRGIKFTNSSVTNSETPTREELEKATNWEAVYEPKQIRMVAFKHKI